MANDEITKCSLSLNFEGDSMLPCYHFSFMRSREAAAAIARDASAPIILLANSSDLEVAEQENHASANLLRNITERISRRDRIAYYKNFAR